MPSDAEVAPETAETTEGIFDVAVSDIAKAANAPQTFIDSLTSNDDEASEPQEVEEEEEVIEENEDNEEEVEESEEDQEEEEQEEVEEEEPKGDSPGIKKRIGKLVERAK